MANPPPGPEGDLYRELQRSRPAPQGICAVNSAGKVLSWSLMFEDDASVLGFLDHVVDRYRAHPDAAVATERFMRFPGSELDATVDNGIIHRLPATHAEGDRCPGDLSPPEGWYRGRIVGRTVGVDGEPVSDARTQDNYIEDIFELRPSFQKELLQLLASAGDKPVRLPREFGRLLAGHAYLGQLDVNPVADDFRVDRDSARQDFQLWARAFSQNSFQIWGTTDAFGKQSDIGNRNDGRLWSHSVALQWHGRLDLSADGSLLNKLTLIATGNEQLKWGNKDHFQRVGKVPDVAHLPAGRAIDFTGQVWYGLSASRDSN